MRHILFVSVLAAALSAGEPAKCAPSGVGPPVAATDGAWTVELGAGAVVYPNFPGSGRWASLVGPSVSVVYKDLLFASTSDGLGANLLKYGNVRAGPLLTASLPRTRSLDHTALNGLHTIPFTPKLGVFVHVGGGAGPQLDLDMQQGLGGHGGLKSTARLEFRRLVPFHHGLYLKGGPLLEVYDRNYTRDYFGVSKIDALQTGYKPFQPGVGGAFGLTAAAVYPLSDRLSLAGSARVSRLIGDIDRSPIIRGPHGSATQGQFGLRLTYRLRP